MDLRPVEFCREHLPVVQAFECGNGRWAELAADWIKQAPPFKGALLSMQEHGNTVWLYFADANDDEYLVGFSSLGKTQWKIPPPDGPKRDVGLIPMLAVASAFQGKPKGDVTKRYSRQILEHVLAQARERQFREVCLTVNFENTPAIRLYEQAGFKGLGPRDGRGNIRMLKLLD